MCGGFASLGGRRLGWRARGGRLVVMVDVASDGGERWWSEVSVGVSGEVEVEVKVFAWLDV